MLLPLFYLSFRLEENIIIVPGGVEYLSLVLVVFVCVCISPAPIQDPSATREPWNIASVISSKKFRVQDETGICRSGLAVAVRHQSHFFLHAVKNNNKYAGSFQIIQLSSYNNPYNKTQYPPTQLGKVSSLYCTSKFRGKSRFV